MPFLDLPEDWTTTITVKPDSIVYRIGNDKEKDEYVQIKLDLFNDAGVIKENITHSDQELGPQIELVIIGADNMPPLSPAEIFYFAVKKYVDFYHENGDHEYENMIISCLRDLFIRADVMKHLMDSTRPPMIMDRD